MSIDVTTLTNLVLLFLLVVTAIGCVAITDLLGSVTLLGIFSLLMASMYLVLGAPDVAITEAAVGAGISTILFLVALLLTGKDEVNKVPTNIKFTALLVVTIMGGTLVYTTLALPPLGDPGAPVHEHVAPYYLNQSYQDIGIPNVVTSVLGSYRGFDTFGETIVILTAGFGVFLLLGGTIFGSRTINKGKIMQERVVVRVVSRFLVPFILLYALYIQFHGEYSPGGGFQAGVIFAAAFILYAQIFGLKQCIKILSIPMTRTIACFGVLLYGGVGVATLLMGGNFLEYTVLLKEQKSAQQLGIVLIEFGVGLTVFAVMLLIYYVFAGRQELEKKGKLQ